MRKENLIKKISREAGIKRSDSNDILNKVIDLITKDLKKGNNVTIENFGEFRIVRKEMKVVMKKNNNKIVYPPVDTIVFIPDNSLTENLKQDE